MSRAAAFLVMGLLAVSACATSSTDSGAVGPSGTAAGSRNSLNTQIACRDRINDMVAVRDRGDIYMPQSTVNTPFSSNYQPGITSRGLPNQFAYDQARADCERSAGLGEAAAPQAPAPRGR